MAAKPHKVGRITGIVDTGGYGFIQDDDVPEGERFFHASGVIGGDATFRLLVVGDEVTYVPMETAKGPKAGLVNLKLSEEVER
jgi:cold shock CspA family protein